MKNQPDQNNNNDDQPNNNIQQPRKKRSVFDPDPRYDVDEDPEKKLKYLSELAKVSQALKEVEKIKREAQKDDLEEKQLDYIESLAGAYNEFLDQGIQPFSSGSEGEYPTITRYRPLHQKRRIKLRSQKNKLQDNTLKSSSNLSKSDQKQLSEDKMYDINCILTFLSDSVKNQDSQCNLKNDENLKFSKNLNLITQENMSQSLMQNMLDSYFTPLKAHLESLLDSEASVKYQELKEHLNIIFNNINNQINQINQCMKDCKNSKESEENHNSLIKEYLSQKINEIDSVVKSYSTI